MKTQTVVGIVQFIFSLLVLLLAQLIQSFSSSPTKTMESAIIGSAGLIIMSMGATNLGRGSDK